MCLYQAIPGNTCPCVYYVIPGNTCLVFVPSNTWEHLSGLYQVITGNTCLCLYQVINGNTCLCECVLRKYLGNSASVLRRRRGKSTEMLLYSSCLSTTLEQLHTATDLTVITNVSHVCCKCAVGFCTQANRPDKCI